MRAFIPTGASFISLVPLLILMVVLGLTNKTIPKRAIFHSTNLCIALEAIGNRRSRAHRSERARLPWPAWRHRPRNRIGVDLHILLAASLPRRIMYHGHHHRAQAMIASETILYVLSFIPRMILLPFAIAVVTQYAAIDAARRKPLPAEIKIKSASRGYFHFAQKNADSVRFLGIIAIGCVPPLSIAIGFLKGFPRRSRHSVHDVHATAVRPAHRRHIHRLALGHHQGKKKNTMTIGAWVIMQGLGSIALFAVRDFPRPPRYPGPYSAML